MNRDLPICIQNDNKILYKNMSINMNRIYFSINENVIAGIYTAPRPPKFESTRQARRKIPTKPPPKNFGMLQRCIK